MEVFKSQAETFEFDVMGRASNYFCKDVTDAFVVLCRLT